ncbi:MAG: metallophosphoesterase [Bacteroidota bacterium]|nr:metallophosphoesterase [Bacteroidota bacterium]
MKSLSLTALILLILLIPGYSHKKYSQIKIGICTDVHLPTMHDADFRITTFMDQMKAEKPDFIIELGDFAEASEKFDNSG